MVLSSGCRVLDTSPHFGRDTRSNNSSTTCQFEWFRMQWGIVSRSHAILTGSAQALQREEWLIALKCFLLLRGLGDVLKVYETSPEVELEGRLALIVTSSGFCEEQTKAELVLSLLKHREEHTMFSIQFLLPVEITRTDIPLTHHPVPITLPLTGIDTAYLQFR